LKKRALTGKNEVPTVWHFALPDNHAMLRIIFAFDPAAELATLGLASDEFPEVRPLADNGKDRINIRIGTIGRVDVQGLKHLICGSSA
jgi:hypothetical protein